jgi:hypothetical protein
MPGSPEADEDNLSYTFPAEPSELQTLSDENLARTWRKLAFANKHAHDRMVEHEMNYRLMRALKSYAVAAERSASRLNRLTVILVLLTVMLVVLTIVLAVTA